MANTQKTEASPKTIKEAETLWHNFIFVSKICGAITAIILLSMALTLV